MSDQYIANAPQNLTMIDFDAIANRYGSLAKSARFIARIMPVGELVQRISARNPAVRDMMYLCEAAEYPGRGFMNVDLRYYGPSFKLPYQSAYEDINLTFICRNEGYERQFFDDWMQQINPTGTFDFGYRDDYRADIQIFQLTDYAQNAFTPGIYGGNPFFLGGEPPKSSYSYTLLNSFPVLVNPQQVTWADDQFLRLGITFTYQWWIREGLDITPPVSTSTYNFNLV